MKKIILTFTLLFIVLVSFTYINSDFKPFTVTQYSLAAHFNSNSSVGGGFDFEEWIDHTKKDINSDGTINAIDLSEMKKILLGKVVYDDLTGDTNDNNVVDIRDLIYLKRYLSDN